MISPEKNVSFRLSIFCGHRCCITSFESLFSNQLNESPSSWLWLTGDDCVQNSSSADYFGANIRWYRTDSFSFKCNYFALQQGESLSSWLWLSGDDYAYSSAFQRWWPLALKEGDVTPRVVELAPACSGLGLAPPSWKTWCWCWSPVEDILSFTSSGFTSSVDSSPLSDGVLVVKLKSKRGWRHKDFPRHPELQDIWWLAR